MPVFIVWLLSLATNLNKTMHKSFALAHCGVFCEIKPAFICSSPEENRQWRRNVFVQIMIGMVRNTKVERHYLSSASTSELLDLTQRLTTPVPSLIIKFRSLYISEIIWPTSNRGQLLHISRKIKYLHLNLPCPSVQT